MTAASAATLLLLSSCGGTSSRIQKNVASVDLDLIPAWSDGGRQKYYVNLDGECTLDYGGESEFGSGSNLRLNLFHNGLAAINTSGTSEARFIDKEGNVKIDCSDICKGRIAYGGFSEGIALLVEGRNRFTAIDTDGNTIFEMDGELHSPMLGGFALYGEKYSHKLGAVNSKGDIVFEAEGDEYIRDFGTRNPAHPSQVPVYGSEGFLYILDLADGKRYFEGERTNDREGIPALDWNDCIVRIVDNQYGLMSSSGEWLIEPQFEYLANDGEWYVVKQDGLIGWCDKNGKMMIEPQFKAAGHAAWNIDNTRFGIDKWAWLGNDNVFIDRKGDVVLECEHFPETNFIGDRCLVTVGGNSSRSIAWMGRDGQIIGETFGNDEGNTQLLRALSRNLMPPYPVYEMHN